MVATAFSDVTRRPPQKRSSLPPSLLPPSPPLPPPFPPSQRSSSPRGLQQESEHPLHVRGALHIPAVPLLRAGQVRPLPLRRDARQLAALRQGPGPHQGGRVRAGSRPPERHPGREARAGGRASRGPAVRVPPGAVRGRPQDVGLRVREGVRPLQEHRSLRAVSGLSALIDDDLFCFGGVQQVVNLALAVVIWLFFVFVHHL